MTREAVDDLRRGDEADRPRVRGGGLQVRVRAARLVELGCLCPAANRVVRDGGR